MKALSRIASGLTLGAAIGLTAWLSSHAWRSTPAGAIPPAISWYTLADVHVVTINGQTTVELNSQVLGLNHARVRLKGFMLPLDLAKRAKRFLLSPSPLPCMGCKPLGPGETVEVVCTHAIPYSREPVTVSGILSVGTGADDRSIYRVTDATTVED